MFTLVTGAPGAGKTSFTIARFVEEEKNNPLEKLLARFTNKTIEEKPKRPIYYRGIRDLKLDWIELTDEQTLEWPKHLPTGAILIVDEAQQLWPVRPSSRPVPEGLSAIETHRHHGWDIVFITQEPGLLDSHARKLANEHFHYVRPFGAPFVTEYHSGTGAVSVGNKSALAGANQTKKKLPSHVWGFYHSSEQHTHKFRPPKIFFIVIAAAVLGVFFFYKMFANFAPDEPEAQAIENSTQLEAQPVHTQQFRHLGNTVQSWDIAFTPEVPGLPFTAPLYFPESMEPKAIPMVHGCMSFKADMSDCTCHTQQGTRITDMPLQMCKAALRDGIFNHLVADESGGGRSGSGEGRDAPRDNRRETSL